MSREMKVSPGVARSVVIEAESAKVHKGGAHVLRRVNSISESSVRASNGCDEAKVTSHKRSSSHPVNGTFSLSPVPILIDDVPVTKQNGIDHLADDIESVRDCKKPGNPNGLEHVEAEPVLNGIHCEDDGEVEIANSKLVIGELTGECNGKLRGGSISSCESSLSDGATCGEKNEKNSAMSAAAETCHPVEEGSRNGVCPPRIDQSATCQQKIDPKSVDLSLDIPERNRTPNKIDVKLLTPKCAENRRKTTKKQSPQQSWLLRLFESKLFDMSIAISYLFTSKEPGVQTYIGNRMFSFIPEDVDFYLPQILNMYIHMHDVAEAIHPYLVHRCRTNTEFSLHCAWIISAYANDVAKPSWKTSQGIKLKNMILNEELGPKVMKAVHSNQASPTTPNPVVSPSSQRKTHQMHKRCISLSTGLKELSVNPPHPIKRSTSNTSMQNSAGDLTTGRAFDNGCTCHLSSEGLFNDLVGRKTECHCGAPRLQPEIEFIKALMNIGDKLQTLPKKKKVPTATLR